MDGTQIFPFEEPGCEHFPLLVKVSEFLVPFQGNELTITTDSNIQPFISCDCCSTSPTTTPCYLIAMSSRVEGGLVINALSGMLHHSKGTKMRFSNYVGARVHQSDNRFRSNFLSRRCLQVCTVAERGSSTTKVVVILDGNSDTLQQARPSS